MFSLNYLDDYANEEGANHYWPTTSPSIQDGNYTLEITDTDFQVNRGENELIWFVRLSNGECGQKVHKLDEDRIKYLYADLGRLGIKVEKPSQDIPAIAKKMIRRKVVAKVETNSRGYQMCEFQSFAKKPDRNTDAVDDDKANFDDVRYGVENMLFGDDN